MQGFKNLIVDTKYEPKKLILVLEGVLINYSKTIIVSEDNEKMKNDISIEEMEQVGKRKMIVSLTSPNVKQQEKDTGKYMEISIRPYAEWFIHLTSIRFDIHLVCRSPEHVRDGES